MRLLRLSYFIAGLYASATLASIDVSSSNVVTPKNIVFGVTFGGPSHCNWVLAIMNELAARGHNTTFIASDRYTRLGKSFERIKTVGLGDEEIGSGEKYTAEDQSVAMDGDMITLFGILMDVRSQTYAAEFTGFKQLFRAVNADVVICDHATPSCEGAASSLNLPFIITWSLAASPDARASYLEQTMFTLTEPTSLTMSFALRFYNAFIVPFRIMASFHKPLQRNSEIRKQVGAPPISTDPWKDSLKIFNTAFGFEPARPLGPLVEMVGPIVQQNYAPMVPQLKKYLDAHRRIAYIAFGRHFTPLNDGIVLILTALLDNFERGVIDGFMWAYVHTDMSKIPNSITLPSGKTRDITEILAGRDPHCRLIREVPQQALLQHPAVAMFLTHGGKASVYESLLNGVPLVVYPIVADQPFNARTVVNSKLGGSFDSRSSLEQASKTLQDVVLDVTGEIRESVERYRHLVRIRSAHGALKGADLVEEVAFMHQGGRLPHRYEASREMSYLKSTNLDLYATLIMVVVGTVYACWRLAKGIMVKDSSTSKKKVL